MAQQGVHSWIVQAAAGRLPISVGWHTYQAEVSSLMGRLESPAMLAKSGLTSRINGKRTQ
jgi:hypothetical protein